MKDADGNRLDEIPVEARLDGLDTGLASEATTRANAITAEATTRADADSALSTAIGNEVTDRQAAITAEVAARAASERLLTGLPSHAPATSTKSFDPRFSVYNLKASNIRKARAGLGRAATGGICEFVALGTSLTAGATAAAAFERLNSWPMKMRDELVRHGVTDGGTGMVRALDGATFDSRWTYGGVWNASFLTFTFISAAGTATFTTDKAGNRVTIGYYDANNGTDQFNVVVNGGAPTVVTSGGGAGWKQVTISAAIAATQTVVITRTVGTVYLRGISIWNSTGGLLVHNIAQSGSKASGSGLDRWQDASGIDRLGVVYAAPTSSLSVPDLVIIELGYNDKIAGATDATVTAAITTIRNRYPTSDAMLVLTNTGASPATVTWDAFAASLYSLADTLDIPLVDFYNRLGSWATIGTNGLNGDAVVHLKGAAYADEGRALGLLLAG